MRAPRRSSGLVPVNNAGICQKCGQYRLLNAKFLCKECGTNKYRNAKTVVDGFTFDSKKEAGIYSELRLREKAKEIHSITLQLPIYFMEGGKAVFKYIADFKYYDNKLKEWVVLDVKGFRNQTYILKKKLIEARFRIKITER